MKERLKTVLLVLLVVGSLVQSYVLIFRFPGSDSVVQSKDAYIRTEEMGPEEKPENLLFPDKMVIHLGEDKHTVFYPNDTFYNLVYNRLKGRTFDNFQRRMVSNIDWAKVRSENRGIELSFDSGIPVTLLQRVMQIVPDTLFEGESINKMWLYSVEGEAKIHVMFFSTEGDVVYEAAQADLTVQDVDQLVDFGLSWTPYKMVDGRYYTPEKELNMVSIELPIGEYTVDQMQRSLFFDPSITRNIREKDGSEIYTDSKRSLQVDQGQKWISYTDPAAPPSGESSPGKDVLSAIDFVNQHGGWNGTYRLAKAGESEDRTLVKFQQYYGGFPILNTSGFQYGVMELDLQQGTVTSYERSLLYLEPASLKKQMVKLTGGEALEAKLKPYEESVVTGLDPAYLPVLTGEGLLLKPVWALKLQNGSVVILE
ncbi:MULTISPECIES: YycH family regulatory protein [Bacillales]|uniref:YycH family regulatory protein n=1 Tax=Bacillales TaxID=1385 RepID=UPI0001788F02|nr:two-component system activity regulator YycH [Paenibacillus sp. Y412MC10]ACX68498.1 YycH family protein [Paenibacillus sp. Y412MC10]MCM3262067.1 two-component system activity regulator YycH [Paenibacillus lautus]